ncbi:hypothetical protein MLD38_013699 [Melastoma candidum]|uniref:Uncharacterized protein n=1 Tax=Melastoma candidum TaxID=119954 RepID=A0ACB9RA14_9MYRT|nr:hypothetical protein MLD38_013699 [Melastoma candidum]
MAARRPSSGLSNKLLLLSLLLVCNAITFFVSVTFYSSCPLPDPSVVPEHFDSTEYVSPDLPSEFHAFTSGQALPFGFDSHFDSDTIFPPVGNACTRFPEELTEYMSYYVNGSCPEDELLAQKLLLKGCEPLPRRRCRPPAQTEYPEPIPFPTCQWLTPPDNSVVWTAYRCKNYDCLVNRERRQKDITDDCHDCFNLKGRERVRWTARKSHPGSLDFTIDEVLETKKPGTIRIGLDIGGGVATFAVRMRERNITIVTTSMNLNGPFNSFIASRGVIPFYISISQRLPFFDNTLDIVHSMHVLSNWIPTTLLHFLLFDVYRVLRPGGLFWLDHFFCSGDQLAEVYAPLIESIGFVKLKWVTGMKLDKGPERREMYLSTLLEKPLNNSW